MIENIIYIDMDEVLVNCFGGLAALYDKSIDKLMEDPRNRGNYNLSNILGFNWENFWPKLTTYTWLNLPKMPWADELIELVNSYKSDTVKVRILTAPILTPSCYAGKVEWIERYYPDMLDELIIARNKEDIVGHKDLLIDDSPHNNKRFSDCGKHKSFFYFPAWGNHFWEDRPDTEEKKEALFAKLAGNIEDKLSGRM